MIMASYEKTPSAKSLVKYERISQIIKLFKISCSRAGSEIKNMEIQNPYFRAVIDNFTPNTFILLVSKNRSITAATLGLNIGCARSFYESNKTQVKQILFE